jgi:hypothetical protein
VNPARAAEVPLGGPLSVLLLPDARQTLLLQAALFPPGSAAEAFRAWLSGTRSHTEELGAGSPGGRLLTPLIARNLSGTGQTEPERLWTYLRTALVREQLRASAARAIYRETLTALREAGIGVVVLRGAAASETVYPEPNLRHCHDLDLFVPSQAVDTARDALARAGLRPTASLPNAAEARVFMHGSGMPIVLHTELFAAPRHRRRPESIVTRTHEVAFLGQPAQLLDPADQVAHLLIHAASAHSRATLLWACDAWLTIRANPTLDWDRLVDEVATRRAALSTSVLVAYLARALAAPIPDRVLTTLRAAAARATRVDREIALWGAWAVPAARLDRALHAASGAGERASLLRWRVAPGPAALMLAGRETSGRGCLRFYLGRPWRLLARGLGRAPLASAGSVLAS